MIFTKQRRNKQNTAIISRQIKIAAIIGFITTFLVQIISLLNPTQGYELSIYDATSQFVWYGLIFSSLCGISIIVSEVYNENHAKSNGWIYGLIIILISRVTLLCIPYIRGYFAWKGDHLSHIGILNDIFISGSFSSNNYYPITHIFLSEIALTSSLSTDFVAKYSTTFMSVFFVISIYLIGKFLFNDKKVTLLSLAATGCAILGYDTHLMPNGWSVLYFSFTIFIILKALYSEFKLEYGLMTIIILIMYPFFHTLSALLLTLFLLLLGTTQIIMTTYKPLHNKIQKYFVLPNSAPSSALICILLISWTMWTLSFKTFHPNIHLLYESMLSSTNKDIVAGMGKTVSKMDFNIFDLTSLIIKVEGIRIIFLILFFISVYIVYKNYRKEQNFKRIIVFMFATLFFGSLYTSYLFNILPGIDSINGGRILIYSIIFTPIFAGVVYAHMLSKEKAIWALLCIGIMMIPIVLSIFGTFNSPYVHRPTPQVTTMDLNGMEWSFVKTEREIQYTYIMSPPYRFADYALGHNERLQRSNIKSKYCIDKVPDHFGYSDMTYLGENYLSDRCFVLTYFDKILYETVYKPVGRFNEADFIRLKNDQSVHYLYNNDECGVYYINSR